MKVWLTWHGERCEMIARTLAEAAGFVEFQLDDASEGGPGGALASIVEFQLDNTSEGVV